MIHINNYRQYNYKNFPAIVHGTTELFSIELFLYSYS